MFLGLSTNFWIVILVFAILLTAILTAAYNEDKTAGM
ncbi:disulfide bond formation protein DsbB [Cohnella thailandensis]|nr:disulfide bond formation protein DsbB [Cohnella thailandensis]